MKVACARADINLLVTGFAQDSQKETMVSKVLVIAVALLSVAAHAAVMGIDMGSENIKITAPKNNNIDVVLNEQSHRKSANYIGFRGEERFFAAEAKAFAARFPDNMFPAPILLVGSTMEHGCVAKRYRDTLHHCIALEKSADLVNATVGAVEDGETVSFQMDGISLRTGSNPSIAYPAESLLGMMFAYVRRTVRKDTKLKIKDAVVTVPAYFNHRQRQAVVNSAALAHVNVVGLMHGTTASALQYGLQNQGFGNETLTVLVYDMGASKTDVGVYTYAPASTKKGKKVKNSEAYGTITTRAIVSDSRLGGRVFDTCIAEEIDRRFQAETKLPSVLAGETLAQRKAIISLMRTANKMKEVLSSNKVAPVKVEGMAPGKDFMAKMSREEFEKVCRPLFERSVALVDQALDRANTVLDDGEAPITLKGMKAFELMGGAPRIPHLVGLLSEKFGKPVDRTLNSDEAASLGAGFYAGVLTNRFRIKSFAIVEKVLPTLADHSVAFSLSARPENPDEAPKPRTLFNGSAVGSRKSITVNRTGDFTVTLYNAYGNVTKADYVVNVTGVDAALRQVAYYNGSVDYAEMFAGMKGGKSMLNDINLDGSDSDPTSMVLNHPNNSHSVRIEFRASETGVVVVEEAEIRIRFAKNVTKRVRVNRTDDDYELEKEKAKAAVMEADVKKEAALKEKAEAKAKADAEKAAADAEKKAAAPAEEEAKAVEDAADAEKPDADVNATEANATKANATKAKKPKKVLTPEEEEVAKKKALDAKLKRAADLVKPYTMESVTGEEMQKKTIAVKFSIATEFPTSLTSPAMKVLRRDLTAFDIADDVRRSTSKAKNDLETYILWVKDEGVLENAGMKKHKVLDAAAAEKVLTAAKKAGDWLDDDATDDTTKSEYLEKMTELKDVVQPFLTKLRDIVKPPKADKKGDKKGAKGGKKADKKAKGAADEASEEPATEDDAAGSEDGAEEPEAAGTPEAEEPEEEAATGTAGGDTTNEL
jgi:molecular chaperone DnaK (HSP70)